MGIAVVCMRGYDCTVKHLQNWLLEGEILDYSLPRCSKRYCVAVLKSKQLEMKVNRLSWYKESNGVMTEWARGLLENHFTNDWNVFFYWVTQTPTRCFCRQSYACRENMCSSEACNFFFSFLKGTLNTFICYYLVSVGEMHFCFACIHGKNLIIMCPSNCQQDPSHDYDPCQTIMLLITKKNNNKQTKCIPDHNPLVNNKILSFFNQVHFLCTIPAQKKKKNQGNYSLAC